MSIDYWWILCHFSVENEAILSEKYNFALQNADLSEASRRIIKKWQTDPEGFFDPKKFDATNIVLYNDFVSAFVVNSFQDFGKDIVSMKKENGFELNEDNCFNFIIVNRCSPGAILWYGLGPELASKLPGFMGNLFVTQDKVPQVLELIQSIFSSIDYQHVYNRALCLTPTEQCEEVEQVLSALPLGLQAAQEKGCGFLCVEMYPC